MTIGVGRKNGYQCDTCGHIFVTEDIDEGVTPFMTNCHIGDCNGRATSMFYRVPQWLAASVEWYKPTSLDGLPPHTVEHVKKGGLLSRRRTPDQILAALKIAEEMQVAQAMKT